MKRRDFLGAGLAAAALAQTGCAFAKGAGAAGTPQAGAGEKFRLKYAPHFGMFEALAGKDPVDQLKFMADQGFTAFEDNGMAGRSAEEQERIGKALGELGLTMGVFVATASFSDQTFVKNDPEMRAKLQDDMRKAVEVAKRVNAKWATIVLGVHDPTRDPGFQLASAVDNLRACCEICEPAGLVMVMEPLNRRNHPNLYLTHAGQAFALCRAVNHPSCKILFDIYHQQITEGDLIPNIDAAWSEIGYIQVGDNPGRCEPGTGEINYQTIFNHLKVKNYEGVIGMEHGNRGQGAEGAQAVIAAYRACDPQATSQTGAQS